MKITTIKKPLTKEKLHQIYDTCNKIFKDEKYFYSKEQVKNLKKDKSTIWLWTNNIIYHLLLRSVNDTLLFFYLFFSRDIQFHNFFM